MEKQSGFRGVALVALAIMVIVGVASVSEAVYGEGDFCWTAKITQSKEGPVTMPGVLVRFHIKSLDPSTFVMTGRMTQAGDNPFFIMGVAAMTGSSIVANLTTSQSHTDGWRDTGVMRATINSETMEGTFYELGYDFDITSRAFDSRFTAGRLVPRACP